MTIAQRFVAERNSRMARLVNEGGARTERATIRITPRTQARLAEMAEAWQMWPAGVASEVLEAALPEVWAAFEAARGGDG